MTMLCPLTHSSNLQLSFCKIRSMISVTTKFIKLFCYFKFHLIRQDSGTISQELTNLLFCANMPVSFKSKYMVVLLLVHLPVVQIHFSHNIQYAWFHSEAPAGRILLDRSTPYLELGMHTIFQSRPFYVVHLSV